MIRFTANSAYKRVIFHSLSWLSFIAYEQSYVYYITRSLGAPSHIIYFYSCNIALFYCHYLLLNRTAGREPPAYGRAISLTILELFGFLLIKAGLEYLVQTAPLPARLPVLEKAAASDLFRNIYYAGLATLTWSAGRIARNRKERAEALISRLGLEKEKALLENRLAKARNAYLQQQLNPHLLFNTLNFIYNTVYRHDKKDAEAVLLLAEIMRFSLEQSDEGNPVPIYQEAEQLENLVTINRYRYHYPLAIDFSVSGDTRRYAVIPLILLTLTENMFKHGDFENKKASIGLSVNETGLFCFTTRNFKKQRSAAHLKSGLGLQNTRMRLDYAYPSAYSLQIRDDAGIYETLLTIQL